MNHIKLFIFIVIVWVISCTSKHNYEDLISAAEKKEKQKDYAGALLKIDQAIHIDSTKSSPFVFRGRMKSLMGNEEGAFKDYSIAVKIDSNNTSAYFYLGKAYSVQNKHDSAIKYFNQAIKSKTVGTLFFDEEYNDFVNFELKKDIPMYALRYHRGLSLFQKNQDAEALSDFKYSLNSKYEAINCNYYIGVILLMADQKSEGCKYLKEAADGGDKESSEYYDKYCK